MGIKHAKHRNLQLSEFVKFRVSSFILRVSLPLVVRVTKREALGICSASSLAIFYFSAGLFRLRLRAKHARKEVNLEYVVVKVGVCEPCYKLQLYLLGVRGRVPVEHVGATFVCA